MLVASQRCAAPTDYTDDEFMKKVQQTEEQLQKYTKIIEEKLVTLAEMTRGWSSYEKIMCELENWLKVKKQKLKDLQLKSPKLHVETSEMDIRKIEVSIIQSYNLLYNRKIFISD